MIYEAMISHVVVDDKGNDRTRKDAFLVDDKNLFAEVEYALMQELQAYTALDVTAIKRSRIKEIANTASSDQDKIFTAVLVDTFTDDDGVEKEMKYTIAFFAPNIDAAHAFIREYVRQGYNMTVTQIKETKFNLL